jgi:hypothetical protein
MRRVCRPALHRVVSVPTKDRPGNQVLAVSEYPADQFPTTVRFDSLKRLPTVETDSWRSHIDRDFTGQILLAPGQAHIESHMVMKLKEGPQ